MLPQDIMRLIRNEQAQQNNNFIPSDKFESYLIKLSKKAEFLIHYDAGTCLGFIAFYCNDIESKTAFITLVLTANEARGKGVSSSLLISALLIMKCRSFLKCRLEVNKNNSKAISLYKKNGFYLLVENSDTLILECDLNYFNIL